MARVDRLTFDCSGRALWVDALGRCVAPGPDDRSRDDERRVR